MSGLIEKIKEMWNPADDEYYEEEGEEVEDNLVYDEERKFKSGKVVNINSGSKLKVVLCRPEHFGEEIKNIADELLKNHTVVLNLEGLDVDIAQRIIDFTSGSTFAISGNLQKISRYIFIITPASVDISGDFQNILSGFGSGIPEGPHQID